MTYLITWVADKVKELQLIYEAEEGWEMETLSGEQNRPEEGDMGNRTVFLATGIGASAPNRSFQLSPLVKPRK